MELLGKKHGERIALLLANQGNLSKMDANLFLQFSFKILPWQTQQSFGLERTLGPDNG